MPEQTTDKLIIPAHIAIIMDGNRRWAKKRSLPLAAGHSAGVEAVHRTVEVARKTGVKFLTIYAFSTENWSRSNEEVNALMSLLSNAVKAYVSKLDKANIKLVFSGRLNEMPEATYKSLTEAQNALKNNTGMVLNVAVNYGGRQEIIDAVNRSLKSDAKEIDEKTFSSMLYPSGIPDPDLLIRTSGELRLSNFLLWQCAYSEFYVTETLWPDFSEKDLIEAIKAYNKREIRRGA